MVFTRTGTSYSCKATITGKDEIVFKLDTGSPYTALSVKGLRDILGAGNVSDISKDLSMFDGIVCSSYSGHSIKLVPCYIRNILVGGTRFEKMYVFVNTNEQCITSLIGTDLIMSSTIVGDGNYITLDNIDYSKYNANFNRLKCGIQEQELLCMSESKPASKGSRLSELLKNAEGNRK